MIPVYGHSEDGLMVVLDNKYLFSGDTLLHTPTITRFPSGSTKKFWKEDMQLLNKIKDIITVYPGHGNPGDMSNMMSKNKRPEKYKTD